MPTSDSPSPGRTVSHGVQVAESQRWAAERPCWAAEARRPSICQIEAPVRQFLAELTERWTGQPDEQHPDTAVGDVRPGYLRETRMGTAPAGR
ncbi:hypothetical protein [Actinomadura chokoriensis]|uniref:Uncharacterized protein n=1 Tax=Actinomadura chokoriensis TaxID=454156 RepID=A0ABV4R8T4_9ACTN